MSDEIRESEDTAAPDQAPAPGTEQAQPDAQQGGSVYDGIDYDRLAAGDEEYAKEVNASLADASVPSEEAAEAPAKASKDEGKGEEFATWDDGDPIYKGEPVKVKKAELKQLVQKGLHMDRTLEEVAPLRRLAKEHPDLAAAITEATKDPEVLKRLLRAAKGQEAESEAADDFSDLEVEGLHPDDVKNVAKVAQALKTRETKKEREQREATERAEQARTDRADIVARANVAALRTHEGEVFDEVRPYMRKLMDQAEREAPPEAFEQLRQAVTDPYRLDKNTGDPLFNTFYRVAKEMYLAEKQQQSAPTAATATRPLVANTSRMQPGSSEQRGGSSGAGQPDWQGMSQAEFDRRMNEALARAN